MTKRELISKCKHARKSHLGWAKIQEKQRRKGKEPIRYVGSARHHRRWVKIYDSLLGFLNAKTH